VQKVTYTALATCALFMSGCGQSGGGGSQLPAAGGFAPILISTSGSAIALAVGTTANISVSENAYDGSFYGSSTDPSVVTVSPAHVTSTAQAVRRPFETGVASFQLSARAIGTATVIFTDQGGHGAATIIDVVAAANQVVLSQSSLSFLGTGTTNAQTVTATETNSSGPFTSSTTDCSGIASISPASGDAFTITPTGAGSCSFIIADGSGHTASLSIVVTVTLVGGS
jgi:hypothetical protein